MVDKAEADQILMANFNMKTQKPTKADNNTRAVKILNVSDTSIGNKNIRFLSYLGWLIFSKNSCFYNAMKIPKKMSNENRKQKLQTAWEDF